MDYETQFPEPRSNFLKPADFQDNPTEVGFKGFKKKGNEDDPKDKRNARTWKEKLKFQLNYSYPQMAINKETGEKYLDSNGEEFENSNWDPAFPHGYSIVYVFDNGEMECGSLPLFNQFCRMKPTPGDLLTICRTGEGKETKWSVKKSVPSVNMDTGSMEIGHDELAPDEDIQF